MHRRHRPVIPGEQCRKEPLLEAVLYRGGGVLTQKTPHCAQRNLRRDHTRQQHKRRPESVTVSRHSHIDIAPQHERKGDAGNAQRGLHHYQQPHQPFCPAGDGAEPLQGMFLFHRCNFPFTRLQKMRTG